MLIKGILPGNLKLLKDSLSTLRMQVTSKEVIFELMLKFVDRHTVRLYFVISNIPQFGCWIC
ncbi:hypothetical protein [Fervidobacterium thailandense]|uniref:hypothetical protein n=1 Tax=Fervidobacterium thailandense TaxID=1008305 RepID=UPI00130129C3|nr:hypothetical protein [Fervidobacterium thailandense]